MQWIFFIEVIPAGRPVAQRCGSRHISDQDNNDNINNNEQRPRNNNEDHHKDSEVEELVSAVEGSEETVRIYGAEAGKSTCAVRDVVSSCDVVNRKNSGSNNTATTIDNDNDNDNDNDKDDSTTSHAQRHGLVDLDAARGKTPPVGSFMRFSN